MMGGESVKLLERYMQTISIAPHTTVTGSLGSVTASYGTKVTHKADVQPLSSAMIRAEYGERADRIRTVYMLNPVTIEERDGVWLEGESAASPPWIVISVSAWKAHTEARIERRDAV